MIVYYADVTGSGAENVVRYEDYKAVADKANELLREAAKVYEMYNKTEEPDGNLVDMQTLQELSDMINR